MATVRFVNKRAEKLSGSKVQKNDNNQHWVIYKGYTISWHCNGRYDLDGDATCFYCKRVGIEDDYQSDYFSGAFWDNIKQCFDFVDRMTNQKKQKFL